MIKGYLGPYVYEERRYPNDSSHYSYNEYYRSTLHLVDNRDSFPHRSIYQYVSGPLVGEGWRDGRVNAPYHATPEEAMHNLDSYLTTLGWVFIDDPERFEEKLKLLL